MADTAVVTAVKAQIPNEAEDLGFNDATINALLDSGLTQSKTILAVLRGMSAKSVGMASTISENSSSRTVDFFNNLARMIEMWAGIVKDEDIAAGTNTRDSARVYTSKRV